jgi:uncharacterized membrane protein YeaQ/YmgE (transglycosylase-associated protein family)
MTAIIGIVGAMLGGFFGRALLGRGLTGFSAWSFLLAIIGAFLLLVIYRLVSSHTTAGRTGAR